VRGTSGFAEKFAAIGPADPQGRSLRQLDLDKRLLKYPCSYMIYSAAFDGCRRTQSPRSNRRLSRVLSGQEKGEPYSHIAPADRQAVLEILRATKKDFTF